MSFISAQKSRVLVGDFSISPKITKVTLPWSTVMLDSTTLADSAKTFIPGQTTSTVNLEGFYDDVGHTDATGWSSTSNAFTYAPQGLAFGNEAWLVDALKTNFEVTSQVASTVNFKIDGQATGITAPGISLKDLAAVTADTDGSSNDNGASTSGGFVANLHVTEFSGFSSAVVTVADSANNSAFSTIGTFASVSGVTGERIAVSGTVRRYVRYSVDVTGTGSITFAVVFARL